MEKNLLEIINFNENTEIGDYKVTFKDGQVFTGKIDTYASVSIETKIDDVFYGVVLTLLYNPDMDNHYITVFSDRVVSDGECNKTYYKIKDIDIVEGHVKYEF